MLGKLLAKDRLVFEHYTHDASVLPMAFLPMWRRQFQRMRKKAEHSSWYGPALEKMDLDAILRRIEDEGPLSTHDFDTKIEGPRQMWRRPPHKIGLDYLWFCGELATCHRDGFTKYYDLAERIFPAGLRNQKVDDCEAVDWLCNGALERIGFGTLGEIRKFWDAAEVREVADWANRSTGDFVHVEIEAADGSWSKAVACRDIEERLAALTAPSSRLRILNPFDPVIRDRVRLKRLFGFDYTVEMFVPAAKRQWGYYVFPLLEGDRFVGRVEARADRAARKLSILNLGFEPGVRATVNRLKKLDAELSRLSRLAGLATIDWQCRR